MSGSDSRLSMCSKPKTQCQSRIVNTNSSGIVTIVIDDDSDAPAIIQPVTTSRPAIAVQSPLSVESPKFGRLDTSVNTNNQQKILITENKTNVILVNSSSNSTTLSAFNGSTATNTCPASSSTTRIACIASQSESLPREVKAHHNHVSRNDTHYVVVKKPNTTVTTMTTCSSTSSSMSCQSSKPSYSPTKYRLWTQQQSSTQSYSRSVKRPSLQTRERVLPPEDTESDCMDDQTFFKYLNLIPKNEYKSKSTTDLQIFWPLRNISKIPKPEKTSDGHLLLSNLKLIRNPIQISADSAKSERFFSDRKIRWYREALQYNERLQKFKSNLPLNTVMRDKAQSELEALHKRLMAEKQRQKEEEDNYREKKASDQRKLLQQEEQKQELQVYEQTFEWTSLMGQRVRHSSIDKAFPVRDCERPLKHERYCSQTDIISSANVTQNTKSTTRITRSNTGFAGIERMWGPRSESHEYCFSRKQRLERYKRLETGLNWKSRIIAMQLKPFDIGVEKITRCPCCLELVEPEWGHSCHDSDDESNQIELMSIEDSELNYNDEEVSTNSEIITAGHVLCYECGSELCEGDCLPEEDEEVIAKITPIEPQIRVFASKNSNETISKTSKVKVEDKMTIEKVPALRESVNNNKNEWINQRFFNQKLSVMDDKRDLNSNKNANNEEDSDDDIVIIKQVLPQEVSFCHKRAKTMTEPVLIRMPNDSQVRQPIKRKRSDPKVHHSSQTNSKDVILVKKL